MGNRRSLYANLALAILAPALFLLLAETVLLLAGVKPLALTEDPLVGYASLQPLFVEKDGPSGTGTVMATNPVKLRHFNQQSFPREKPEGTYRIFTLGGSTTYGHPWRDPVSYGGWLRELLPVADPSRKWEVINAGGISYASYREAKLVEEIARYEPDLIVVYSGHNEFLEERTYRSAAGVPAFIREASALLDRTRTYTVMRRVLRAARSEGGGAGQGDGAAQEEGGGSGPAGKKTRLAAEVDDVLSRTIGPTSYTRDDALRVGVLDHFRLSLRRMADLAHDAGAQALFLTTPGNERDCAPFKSEPAAGLPAQAIAGRDRLIRRADSLDAVRAGTPDSLEAARHLAGAFAALDSAAALDPRNAALLYRAGKAALAAGLHAEAKRLLVRSLDEDVCPLRALPAMRAIVLEVARETGSLSLDVTSTLESATRERLGHDILGEPEFVDHVHLSIDEYRNLALGIIGKLASAGVVKPSPGWNEGKNGAVAAVTNRVMARMGPRELGEGLHNIAKVLNWAGKHEDAARIAEKALAVDSTGLEAIWSSLFVGAALERRGRSVESIPHYRRAARLDSTNAMARQYLHDALERAGMAAEAMAEAAALVEDAPGDAGARARLGTDLFQQGRLAEAIPHLEAAVAAAPGRSDLLVLLGEALRRAGRPAEAEKAYGRALRANPREGRAYLGLARLAESRGNAPEAIDLYAQALSASPDLHEARSALSRVLQGMPTSP
jgi:tetratricopeptide (TPR) repeat protein